MFYAADPACAKDLHHLVGLIDRGALHPHHASPDRDVRAIADHPEPDQRGVGFGGAALPVARPDPLHIGPFLLTVDQLIVVALGIALVLTIHLMLTRTRLGKSMRAMSDNTALAMTSGIDTRRITTITWFLTGAMSGLAGVVLGITAASLTPSSGETFLFVIFAAVIVGGVGSVYGAIIGALIIGLATEVSAVYINPAYKLDTAFVILIAALLLRPSGLFARAGKA